MSKQQSTEPAKTKRHSFFLWMAQAHPRYVAQYGGQRAGIPKGELIPFPPNKILAAFHLLCYGAPGWETLRNIARGQEGGKELIHFWRQAGGISEGLLRLWRSEGRFMELYRRLVWDLADAYVENLVKDRDPSLPSEEVQDYEKQLVLEFRFFGCAVQQAILRRVWVDILKVEPNWIPIVPNKRMVAESLLVGEPLAPAPAPALSGFFDGVHLRIQAFALLELVHRAPDTMIRLRHLVLAKIFYETLLKTFIPHGVKMLQAGEIEKAVTLFESLESIIPNATESLAQFKMITSRGLKKPKGRRRR